MAVEFQLMCPRSHRQWALHTGLGEPSEAGPTHAGWRLIGNNHRELARGPRTHPTEQAFDVVRSIAGRSADITIRLVSTGRGTWQWRAVVDDVDVAVAPRTFSRRRDCERCAERFLGILRSGEFGFATERRRERGEFLGDGGAGLRAAHGSARRGEGRPPKCRLRAARGGSGVTLDSLGAAASLTSHEACLESDLLGELEVARTCGRFQVFSAGGRPRRGHEVAVLTAFRWRLLAGNHRALGESATVHTSSQAALAEVATLIRAVTEQAVRLSVSCDKGLWWWRLDCAARRQPIVQSTRGYQRRIQSDQAVRQFIELAAVAPVDREVFVLDRRFRS